MEIAGTAYDDADYLYVRFQGAVGLQCLSERFVDFVYVFNGCLFVAIYRVFAFNALDLSSSTVC